MIEIEAPDGSVVEFPDGTPDATIESVMQAEFGAPTVTEAPILDNRVGQAFEVAESDVNTPVSNLRALGAITDGLAQGMTFGFSDEIASGLASATGLGGDFGEFDKNLAAERIRMAQNRQAAPGSELTGQIAGSIGTGVGLAKSGLLASARLAPNAGIGARTGAAALDAAAAGAAFGAGDAEENRGQAALEGGAIGLATGAVVGNVLGRVERSKIARQVLPVTKDIKAAAQSLYQEAEDAGVRFSQRFYDRLLAGVRQSVGRTHSGLHPKTQAALEVLENERGRTLSLSEIDEVRQVVNNAISGADPSDARLLGKIVTRLDGLVSNATTRDFLSGDKNGVRLLGEARKLWQKQAKSQVIDDIVEKAQNQATGFENGLRVQFRSLANNPKRFRQFNKKEQAAIKKIVRGGPVENTLRAIGWLDPRGVFGALLTGGTLTGVGAAPGAGLAAAGFTGKKLAESATRGNVNNLQRIVNTGTGQIPLPPPTALPGVTGQVLSQNIQANDLLPPLLQRRGR